MRIVVSTPTGNIGRALTQRLLDAGAEVVLTVRDPAKVEGFADRGAVVHQGTIDDHDFLSRAAEGTDALFWVTPPDYAAEDLRVSQNRFGAAAAAAIDASGIRRVVNVSSIGAQLSEGTGPVKGLHDVEIKLNETRAAILHLRPAFFFENFLTHLDGIREAGSIFRPVPGSARQPMIATQDIAAVAADNLLDDAWSDTRILGLHGPADLTFDDAAEAIAAGIGKEVRHVEVTEEQTREALMNMGLGPGITESFLELERSIAAGLMESAEPRTEQTTTPTRLEDWARDVMRPMLAG